MKKGLSVLLIAAALFGFYGGATNLNDVLACKDYFTSASGASDDMQRLEDGLNQLKENEQAYLDGQVALADGEKALADAEVQLADGEAQLAEGRKTLAKGEADYAAAPGKLADARKQIAKGEKDLAAGEKKLQDGYKAYNAAPAKLAAAKKQIEQGEAGLTKGYSDLAAGQKKIDQAIADRAALKSVRNKIADVEPTYKPWLQKFNKLVASIVDDAKNPSKGVLYDAGAVAVGLVGDDSHQGILQAFGLIKGSAGDAQDTMDKIVSGVKQASSNTVDISKDETRQSILAAGESESNPFYSYAVNYEKAKGARDALNNAYSNLMSTYAPQLGSIAKSIGGKVDNIKKADYQATELRKSAFGADMDDTVALMDDLAADSNIATVKAIAKQLGKDAMVTMIDDGIAQVKGLANASKSSKSDYDKAYDELKPNAAMGKKIGSKVATAAKAILSNKDIAAGLTGAQKEALKPYMNASSITGLPNIELLYGTMTLGEDKKDDGKGSLLDNFKKIDAAAKGGVGQYDTGIENGQADLEDGKAKLEAGEQALADGKAQYAQGLADYDAAGKQLAQGEKDLAAGKKKLADGKAQYAQGLKDYKAAPAKLADGRRQLAEGEAQLADGYAQYEDGKKQLEEGKAKLAEYEDGEQQVRDGLATLVGTQPMGNVQSIADRIGNDTDFDNGDKHLELDEGLSAVEAGKGYAADLTAAVTDEIMGRAVGTGFLLGAGALAVLAAILSFLKKNKGAGVSAILAAIAGCVGVFLGNGAGTQFSSVAGSVVGATPWVAAGILAAVAAVHAIVHFTAKKEA